MVIPDNIIERTAELWTRWLRKPTFDNGDPASMNKTTLLTLSVALAPANTAATEERLAAFKAALIERLTFLRDHDGESVLEDKREPADRYGRVRDIYYFRSGLSCDYDPDETLALAAIDAGWTNVSKTVFPWKTDTFMYPGHVMVSAGYAAPSIYHYPLSDGKWFITDLNGGDHMKELVRMIDTGEISHFGIGAIEQ